MSDLPSFKAGVGDIVETIRYMKENKYNVNRIINQKRAIPDIIAEIASLEIFSKKPTKFQISIFRKNFKALHLNDNEDTVEKEDSDTDTRESDWKILTEPVDDPNK